MAIRNLPGVFDNRQRAAELATTRNVKLIGQFVLCKITSLQLSMADATAARRTTRKAARGTVETQT